MTRILLAALLFGLGLIDQSWAASLPACRSQWRQGEHRYDFKEPYAKFHQRLKRSACEKEWTVLVYMAADNDLYPYALWDLYEMEAAFQGSDAAGSTLKTDLIIQVDGTAKNDLRRLHIFSGPVAFASKQKSDFDSANLDQVKSPIVARLDEARAGSEQKRLTEFLLWAAKEYPSRNTMVVVWGHGQGWKAYPVKNPARSRYLEKRDTPAEFPATSTDAKFGGVAFSQTSGTWLDIPALRASLDQLRRATGKPIDVYASDACLMQMVEVAHELSSSTRFVVGSTQIQNFLGLPYRRLLYELNTGRFNGERRQNRGSNDGSDEPYLLARMIPNLVKQSLDPRNGSQGRANREAQQFLTSSAITSAELQRNLLPELQRLSGALRQYIQEDPMRVMDLQFVMQNVPAFEGSAQDLGVFLGFLEVLVREEEQKTGKRTISQEKLRDTLARTKNALNESVLAWSYGSAYGIDNRTVGFIPRAVSIWLPASPEEYQKRRGEFLASRLWRESRWNEWLDLAYPKQ